MKKIIWLVLLLPSLALARFIEGTVTMNDLSVRKGFVEVPSYLDRKINFRSEPNGKTEKLSIDDVAGFEIIHRDKPVKFVTEYVAFFRLFNSSEIKVEKRKFWLEVIREGAGSSMYSAYSGWSPAAGPNGFANADVENEKFFIKKAGMAYALYFYMTLGRGAGHSFKIKRTKSIEKEVNLHFGTDCPGLFNRITTEDLAAEGLSVVIKLYDDHCR
ncbi:hypothetical protein HYN48_09515 [Flavobacterium magnum]|uniref:Uncharacterized protein n=1 Tax=Flavobacterium magnum TaxID=2162713 RepID=A0A2S0RHU9_9FLAO|nr:hypothetical protein [Flavobacterium magnum]AWA30302.1 hypothetical protein HYN48_09515 [Flavobacterium magnum]